MAQLVRSVSVSSGPAAQSPSLLDCVLDAIRVRHYSHRPI